MRIYDGNIIDEMSERLENLEQEVNRKFQGLTEVEKQSTSLMMNKLENLQNYLQNLGKSIDAKLENLEKSTNDKLVKLAQGMCFFQ